VATRTGSCTGWSCRRNQAARWFGIAVIGLNLISQLFFIPAYPFWALTIIAFDVFALYGLCVYGGRANVTGG
jgi:hypothetical protein